MTLETLQFEGKLARLKTSMSFFTETATHISYGTLGRGEYVFVLSVCKELSIESSWKANLITSNGLIGEVYMWQEHPLDLLELVE